MENINTAIIERLERVVETLQENSVKMGQLLAVHNEKLEKQDRIDGVLFEKIESVHREVNRQALDIKLKRGANVTSEKSMTVSDSWKRKCGAYLVLLLLFLSSCLQSDKE
jgi:hypothetical protein